LIGQPERLPDHLDPRDLITIRSNLNPRAEAQFDQGPADLSLRLDRITLMLKPSREQQAALETLLRDQQDPSSPNYRRWLTPEEYGDRFGFSPADIAKIVFWLQSQGLAIEEVARGRNWIAFSGSVAQVQAAFETEIHRYNVAGEMHFANSTEPSVPRELAPAVIGILGLDDFYPKPLARPYFTSGSSHYLAPDDIAVIYDLTRLYNLNYFGDGQSIVIVGQSDIVMSDISDFRTMFNLPATLPTEVLVGRDPGINSSDLQEADLDLEWAGAVARNANLIYVYSRSVFNAVTYAVSNNLAPIISDSFGECEPGASSAGAQSYQHIAQQANAQGITWIAASGDAGAAGCNSQGDPSADQGLAVILPASVPEVTGVGGTVFNDGSGNYWNSVNGPNSGSAISYIPEQGWNDTSINRTLAASGGGASIFFSKPGWQTGPGVPNDGARDVPDAAFTASADHDGYLFCNNGSCVSENPSLVNTLIGGTSASTPVFAGILAVLQQYQINQSFQTTPALGNINPTLYQLAQNVAGVFHDITTGNNIVPCTVGTTDCTTGSFGYTAGPGYDLVTGLGSVDAWSLASSWHTSQCIYTLPAATTVSSQTSAFSLSIGTQSICPWTVWTSATWITINPSTGTGSGNTNLSFSSNNTTSARAASIYVAGQTFTLTQNPPAPALSISKSHSGTFTQGQQNVAYTVTVSNNTGTAPTSGLVTVTETLPPGLTLVSMAGSGWSCSSTTCNRSGPLAAGASYPTITVTVNVASTATSPQVNQVSVSGGGSATASASDSTVITVITPTAPALSISKSHSGNFTQGQQNAAYTVTVSNTTGSAPTSGLVTVTETLPPGLTLVSMAGSAWSCSSNTCSRSDALAAGASYPAITVTVNVTSTAASPQVNQVSVSGGGAATASASDSTVINVVTPAAPSLSISKSHSGTFTQGQQNAAYTVMVSNTTGTAPTSGLVTVTETLPPGLTLVSMAGSGWPCSSTTCSRSDALAAGASYPAITVTVNVTATATSPQVNQVSVSGGGSATASASDSTTISASNPAQPTLSLGEKSLNFGVSGALATSAQTVSVNFINGSGVPWTASSSEPNIMVSPTSGNGNGTLQISATAGSSGVVTVSAPGAATSPQTITVNVSSVAPSAPYGSFDTPVNDTTGVAGAIPVTGWALDNVEVSNVGIWRDPVAGETASANGLVFIGDAVFVAGARPDVQAAYPNAPFNYRAGWGYMPLTNFLPNASGSGASGNGTYTLHAIVTNAGGQTVDLGARTIAVDNANASKPFGTIDTPDQGGTALGNAYVNFGWALTQNPYGIPTDGSTITVFMDGLPLGHPTYNQYRSDIASLFPGLANSNGAIGFYYIDTTTLANGVHTISWSVSDNAGRNDGIGSRYFTIENTGAENVPASEQPIERAKISADATGLYSLSIEELDRVELPVGATRGYLLVNNQRRPLPIGSTLKGGRFYWQPGPGFLGGYDLLFEQADATLIRVQITIEPKSYAAREPQ